MRAALILAVAGLIVLIIATPDGIFNGLDLAGWVLLGLGIHRLLRLRRAPSR